MSRVYERVSVRERGRERDHLPRSADFLIVAGLYCVTAWPKKGAGHQGILNPNYQMEEGNIEQAKATTD